MGPSPHLGSPSPGRLRVCATLRCVAQDVPVGKDGLYRLKSTFTLRRTVCARFQVCALCSANTKCNSMLFWPGVKSSADAASQWTETRSAPAAREERRLVASRRKRSQDGQWYLDRLNDHVCAVLRRARRENLLLRRFAHAGDAIAQVAVCTVAALHPTVSWRDNGQRGRKP